MPAKALCRNCVLYSGPSCIFHLSGYRSVWKRRDPVASHKELHWGEVSEADTLGECCCLVFKKKASSHALVTANEENFPYPYPLYRHCKKNRTSVPVRLLQNSLFVHCRTVFETETTQKLSFSKWFSRTSESVYNHNMCLTQIITVH